MTSVILLSNQRCAPFMNRPSQQLGLSPSQGPLLHFQHFVNLTLTISSSAVQINLESLNWSERVCVCACPPHPPLHRHGTDVLPAPVQTPGGLLDGVALRVAAASVGIVEQNITERQHRRHALGVLLDVSLQILQDRQHGNKRSVRVGGLTSSSFVAILYFYLEQQKNQITF